MNKLMRELKNVFVNALRLADGIKTKIKEKGRCLSKDCFRSIGFTDIICWSLLALVLFLIIFFVFPGFSGSHQQQNKYQNRYQNKYQNKHIGVVNITGIIDEFVKTQAKNQSKNNVPQEVSKKRVQVFGKELEKILHEISDKNKVVLMPSEAVIAGATDYTSEVQKHLLQATVKSKQEGR